MFAKKTVTLALGVFSAFAAAAAIKNDISVSKRDASAKPEPYWSLALLTNEDADESKVKRDANENPEPYWSLALLVNDDGKVVKKVKREASAKPEPYWSLALLANEDADE